MRRSLHYEAAFAHYLREARIPYVAVDEARKSLIPPALTPSADHATGALKSFDFVLYGPGQNLLVDVKGRRLAPGSRARRLECWATRDDVDSLLAWERLFGDGFASALVFVYWFDGRPEVPLFEDLFEHSGRWYAARAVPTRVYVASMKPRSLRWRTVDMPALLFEQASGPLGRLLSSSLHHLPTPVASAS